MNSFKDKDQKDLEKNLADKREALRVFRFGSAGSKAKNVREGRFIRKDIARILTEIQRRQKKA